MAEYWAEVGLTFSDLTQLSNKNCTSDEVHFVACMQGVNHALSELPTRQILVPTVRQKSEQGFGAVMKDFGAVRVVGSKKNQSDSLADLYAAIKDEKRRTSQGWSDLWQKRTVSPVNFDSIRTWVTIQPDLRKVESATVASFVNGYIMALTDPHTMYLPLQYVQDSMQAGGDDFVGIGMRMRVLSKDGKTLFVVDQPLDGSPALKAGIRANDVITHVDGATTEGLKFEDLVEKIRGVKGTSVKVTVTRAGQSHDIDVIRDLIELKNVTTRLLGKNKDIGYLKLNDFMTSGPDGKAVVYTEARAGLEKLLTNPLRGIVFDLRDNGGGLLPEAVRIASLFLKNNSLVLITKDLKGGNVKHYRTADEPLTDLPLVVLINSRSASASEIVAGALQDHQRAFLVGERSFGKGTVQKQFVPQGMDKMVMRMTVERFYRPSGLTNQIVGDIPDIEVFSSPTPSRDDKVAYREEDEYAALPPVGATWQQSRPGIVQMLEACVKKGAAAATFQASKSDAIPPDYQALVATDSIDCIVSQKLDVRRESQAISALQPLNPLATYMYRSLDWERAMPVPE